MGTQNSKQKKLLTSHFQRFLLDFRLFMGFLPRVKNQSGPGNVNWKPLLYKKILHFITVIPDKMSNFVATINQKQKHKYQLPINDETDL